MSYDAGGLSGLGRAEIAPILNRAGKTPQAKWRNDAEALSPWQRGRLSGRVLVGFEGDTRIGVYDLSRDGLGAKAQSLTIPKAIVRGPRNSQLEAIGRFEAGPWQGQVLAISEANRDGNGNIRAWVFGGKMTTAFALSRFGDYRITDLAVLPDGQVLTLERRYGGGELPGMAIRRFNSRDIANAATLSPELLFEARAPFYQIDNMEGIAVHTSGGELRVTVISDDNFNHELQQTLLMQFRLRE